MSQVAGGFAHVAEEVQIPELGEVLIRVDCSKGDRVTLALQYLRERYAWDGDVHVNDFTEEGEEWWTLKGVEGLDEYPIQPEAPVLLSYRLVS